MAIFQCLKERKVKKERERAEAQARQEDEDRQLEPIKVFKQSYEEAKRSASVGELDLISGLVVAVRGVESAEDAVKLAEIKLKRRALEVGAQYVFGTEYSVSNRKSFPEWAEREFWVIDVKASGDAYKNK